MKVVQSAMDSDIIVIEDVPYGITSQAMVKPVIRLQGFLIGRLIEMQCAERTVFMSPSVWMKDYPGVQHSSTKGLSKAAADKERIETAASHAERAGYVPPDLVAAYVSSLPEGAKVLKKNTNILEKSMTDYVSAWLMSEYARTRTLEELLALPGCSAATL